MMPTKTIESTEKAAKQEMAHKYKGARWSKLRMMAEPGDLLYGAEVSPKEVKGSHNRVITAPDLRYRQFSRTEEASETGPLPPIQEASCDKYRLWQFYRLPVTPDLLRFHDDGKGMKKIRLLETMLVHMVNIVPFTQVPEDLLLRSSEHDRRCCQVAFLKEGFAIAGILYFMKPRFKLDVTYESSTLQRFVQFMEAQRSGFKHLFGIDFDKNLREHPELQLNSLLDMVGLIPMAVTSINGRRPDSALYKIEPMNYILLMHVINERMNIMPEEDDEPSEHWENEVAVDWEAAMKSWVQE